MNAAHHIVDSKAILKRQKPGALTVQRIHPDKIAMVSSKEEIVFGHKRTNLEISFSLKDMYQILLNYKLFSN